MNKGLFGFPGNDTPSQGGWTIMQLLSGWVNYDPNPNVWAWAAWYKDTTTGLVHLRGLIKSGTISASIPFYIMPPGCRTVYPLIIAVLSNGAIGRLTVQSNGNLLPETGNNGWFSLSGIYYSVLP